MIAPHLASLGLGQTYDLMHGDLGSFAAPFARE